jgi:hypothetical protein
MKRLVVGAALILPVLVTGNATLSHPACPGDGDCCEDNGTPGCDDAECCNWICDAVDPFCCDVFWDTLCVREAHAFCDVCADPACPGEGDCCEPGGNGTPGCDDVLCCNWICAMDPHCCTDVWDELCAIQADASCSCEFPPCPLDCPPGALDEGEPCGFEWNNGCDWYPVDFEPAACGDTFCGLAWANNGSRDTDWFMIWHDGGTITATLVSQFPGNCLIVDGVDPDGEPCDPVVVGTVGCSDDCANIQVASATLYQGWYVVLVGFGDCAGNPILDEDGCASPAPEYYVTIECEPGPACALDEHCDDGDPCNGDEWCDPLNNCRPAPPDPDCNENGLLDACDIAAGTSPDCNDNGIPDECDIVDQTSSDDDGNGVPDDCEWCSTYKLVAADGAEADGFGISVAADDGFAVIGSWRDDDFGSNTGSAYVFRQDGVSWVQNEKLLPSDAAQGQHFGTAVAISGDIAVVGAYHDGEGGQWAGAAYVFRYDGATWHEERKLLAEDGSDGDLFGSSVAVDDDTVVVGASSDDDNGEESGSAYVFRYNGATWVQEQKLVASAGALGDQFGSSAGVEGDAVVIGAYRDDDNGEDSGSAHVFRFNGSTWDEEQKLLAPDGAPGDYFGRTVGISGDGVVVGAYRDDDNGDDSGSAYVFRYSGPAWVEEQKLLAPDGAEADNFGSVSISGDTAVVGAATDDHSGVVSGSAYVFRHDGSTWTRYKKLVAYDRAAGDRLGRITAVSGDTVVVAAHWNDDHGENSGSAYVFDISEPCPCPWDLDASGDVGITDFLELLAAWGADPGGPPDFNGDGTVDVIDFLSLLANWGLCP